MFIFSVRIFAFSIWTALPLSSVQLQCFGPHSTYLNVCMIARFHTRVSFILWSWETVCLHLCDMHFSWLVACFMVCHYVICISPVHFLLQSLISFSAALCLSSSFWLRIWEIVDCEQPNHWESSAWETFSEARWMISCFWLSDKPLHLCHCLHDPLQSAWCFHHTVMIAHVISDGNMQSKTKQILAHVYWSYPGHIMTLNEFQNGFGFMMINRLLSLCKFIGFWKLIMWFVGLGCWECCD